jgi:hypothetical protein
MGALGGDPSAAVVEVSTQGRSQIYLWSELLEAIMKITTIRFPPTADMGVPTVKLRR